MKLRNEIWKDIPEYSNYQISATMPPEAYTDTEVSKDLDICFGGEE